MKTFLFFFLLCLLTQISFAATITVINTNNSGVGSLRQAISTALDGDTIRFNSSLISSGNDTIILTNEIYFTKSLVFKGLYNSTDTLFISGNNTNRIFYTNLSATPNKKLIIDSLFLIDADAGGSNNGGAIYILYGNDISVTNSIIKNNSASSGGGIYLFSTSPSAVTVKNSIIDNNIGGGISTYSSSSNVIIKNSIITNNNGTASGVSFTTTTSPSLVSVDSSFIHNNSSTNGGGVGSYSSSSSSSVIVKNSILTNNTATNGGAVFSYSTASNSTATLIVENSILTNNTATSGGALFSYSTASNSTATLSIFNCSIDSNTAEYGGGVFCSASSTAKTLISKSTLAGNIASGVSSAGGAIFSSSTSSDSSLVAIQNSTIVNNSAPYGAAIYSSSSSSGPSHVTIQNSTLFNNIGTLGAGVFSSTSSSSSSVVTIGSSIVHNSNNIYSNPGNSITSLDYNIFNTTLTGIATNDQIIASVSTLNLLPLSFNGGITKNMMPGPGSPAIDKGNPSDLSASQNSTISGIRDVGASEGIIILPIELINFDVKIINNNKVKLFWQTASELNNDYFTIERSINAIDWEKVKNIDGAGNSSVLLKYSIEDDDPFSFVSYYRLKQTDFNGSFKYSSIKSIKIENHLESSFEIYPNPANNKIILFSKNIDVNQIKLFNILGKNVSSFIKINKTNEEKYIIDLSNLNSGPYYIKTNTFSRKIYKQ